MSVLRKLTLFPVAVVVLLVLCAAPAFANFGFVPGKVGFHVTATNADGTPDLQAGSHPFALTTTFELNRKPSPLNNEYFVPQGNLKNLAVELPPGLVGNATAVPQCTQQAFYTPPSGESLNTTSCAPSTAVGVVHVTSIEAENGEELDGFLVNVYNLVPAPGMPAEFGFSFGDVPVLLTTAVRGGRDYGVTVESPNTTQGIQVLKVATTFWGVPGDPRHDSERGRGCLEGGNPTGKSCPSGTTQVPLLTLPSACAGPLHYGIRADSWQAPGQWASDSYESEDSEGAATGLDGCSVLPFSPSLQIVPDGLAGSTPTGLNVNLDVPQEEDLNPQGLSEADVRDTTVALPEGVVLNPSASDGLQACSEAQAGYEGFDGQSETPLFSPGAVSCPDASKVATVKIKTPLLAEELEGAVYLAAQEANPFGSLVALYLVAEDPVAGVRIKLAGEVKLDQATGRLVTTFKNTPALPFEELKLEFFGTDRAPLATPALCGTYTSEASFAAWSGTPAVAPLAQFNIDSGPDGSACADPLPFAPSLAAGTTNIQAGAFSPFTMTMSREDGQQTLSTIRLHMPRGLLGALSSVKLCGEPQAQAGTCGPESEIGETIVSVGLGNDPFSVTGGKVYITGPYEGAPYGLSIVNPAKAGPFDLEKNTSCDCIVVRAKIAVDPLTAVLTVTSDPLPTILDGIPLQIRHVNVTIDRPGFTFNPTSCAPLAIGAELGSTQGGHAAVSDPFQVTNCGVLGFKPKFTVSSEAHTSRADGASLDVKLSYPPNSVGTEANIASVKVDLPRQLPSRLSTLQKACADFQFEANPASCPAASRVGTATATTPILAESLSGPAYFVSHGGEKFPELVIVLSGGGVTVQLRGETFISKAGITSSTFRTVPDVPIGTFELKLPEGPDSALAANGNLCTATLEMPTAFVAQDGATIHQNTPIAITGCKAAIRVKRTKVRAAKATILVGVPSAGTLVASGAGFTQVTKRLRKAGTATVTLTLSKRARLLLARHRGRRLKVRVNLSFVSTHGGTLSAATSVLVG